MDSIGRKYGLIITSLFVMRQDFEESQLPEDAVQLLDELIETCLSDYRIRFSGEDQAGESGESGDETSTSD